MTAPGGDLIPQQGIHRAYSKPHYKMQFNVIPMTAPWGGTLSLCRGYTGHIHRIKTELIEKKRFIVQQQKEGVRQVDYVERY